MSFFTCVHNLGVCRNIFIALYTRVSMCIIYVCVPNNNVIRPDALVDRAIRSHYTLCGCLGSHMFSVSETCIIKQLLTTS